MFSAFLHLHCIITSTARIGSGCPRCTLGILTLGDLMRSCHLPISFLLHTQIDWACLGLSPGKMSHFPTCAAQSRSLVTRVAQSRVDGATGRNYFFLRQSSAPRFWPRPSEDDPDARAPHLTNPTKPRTEILLQTQPAMLRRATTITRYLTPVFSHSPSFGSRSQLYARKMSDMKKVFTAKASPRT